MAHEKGKGEICFHFFCLLNISSGRQHSSSSFFSEMLDVCFDMFFFVQGTHNSITVNFFPGILDPYSMRIFAGWNRIF